MIHRIRIVWFSLLCLAWSPASAAPPGFVQVDGPHFVIDGAPYRFVGVNLWYGAYLGAEADYGDRARLEAELDHLKALGVDNVRVLGASERSPFRKSLDTVFRDRTDEYNETLLKGLDVLLAELAERDMRAVIYLNNFWEWSGGMGTYLFWTNGGDYVDLGDPNHPWPAYPNFTARFYESKAANRLYRDYVGAVIGRTNTQTGAAYRADPTIMAWQLANEPRPAADAEANSPRLRAFHKWITETARFIKSLDADHLVSTGNEGLMGCNEIETCYLGAHTDDAIDYLTFHLWPRNWSWYDPETPEARFDAMTERSAEYVTTHVAYARALGKPIVLEEFGLDRDGAALSPESSTLYRDAFFARIFAMVEEDKAAGGPFAGVNIWSWGGAGRAAHADFQWRSGDTGFTGDPPQEPQGRNSVFDSDASTLALIKAHADALD